MSNFVIRTGWHTKTVLAYVRASFSIADVLGPSRNFSFSKFSCDDSNEVNVAQQSDKDDATAVAELRKEDINRLLYRARQRGWLELDLIIGRWAKRNLEDQKLPRSVVQDLELLLTQENPDLFKWLTGQLPTPPEMLQNSAYRMIKADLDRGIEINGSPAASTPAGAMWVRGWNDSGSPLQRGNQD